MSFPKSLHRAPGSGAATRLGAAEAGARSQLPRGALCALAVLVTACHGGGKDGLTGPPGTLSVWTQGVGTKVQPSTAPGSASSISVASARKAWASAQLVVRGKKGYVTGVRVAAAADLDDGAGHTLAKENLTFFREAFIDFTGVSAIAGNVPAPSSSPSSDGKVPDPLVPLVDPYSGADAGQPFDVPGESNQPVFVDVFVPAGTTPGTYSGTVHVSASGGLAADVPISVTVWGLDLPDMGSVTTHFKMSIEHLLDYHGGISKCSGGDCYLDQSPHAHDVVKRYEELAHQHRVDPGPQLVEQPVSGCNVPSDWSAFDAAMAPYLDGTHYADGVPSGWFDVPFSPGETFGLDACSQAQYTALAAAWANHLQSKGWFEKAVVYAFDEPPECTATPCDPIYAKIAQSASWLQKGDPGWKARTMDTTSPDPATAEILNQALGIYTVNLPWYDDWNAHGPYFGRAQWPALFAQGIQLWFYESNSVTPPYPTFASNTLDGLEPVMAMWGSWYERATGFLYYDIANWNAADPWGPNVDFGLTGDGVLIYPGNHDGLQAPAGSPDGVGIDGPVPSYRLKMVRNGLQDWALFRLADQKGLTSAVKAQVEAVYQQLGGCNYSGCPAPPGGFFWKTDEAKMDAIREAVVQAILAAP